MTILSFFLNLWITTVLLSQELKLVNLDQTGAVSEDIMHG